MSIRRAPRPDTDYTIIRNAVFSANVSAEALGILVYLLSKPDDWVVSKQQLRNRFGIGRDKADKVLNELTEAGFVTVEYPVVKGRFAAAEFTVYDAPCPEKPSTEKPEPEKPHLLSTDNNQSLSEQRESPKPAKRVSYPQDFSEFWIGYPTDSNMSKKEAHDVWKKLDSEQRRQAIASLPNFKAYCQQNDWYRPIHACRYLRKERFAGFVSGPATGAIDIEEINRQLQA